LKELTYINEIS